MLDFIVFVLILVWMIWFLVQIKDFITVYRFKKKLKKNKDTQSVVDQRKEGER